MECKNIEDVRTNIDRIDEQIISLIAERGTYVKQAAQFKKDSDGVRDSARVDKVITKVRALAQEKGADPTMVENIYRDMIHGFIQAEMKEFKKKA